jgi:ParB family transcriptional regulator, chromosome partitioning protein
MAAQQISARKLSVREAEKLVTQQASNGRQGTLLRVKHNKPRDVLRLEEQLSDLLTAQVEIRIQRRTKRGEQGEIAIAFGSLEELNGLLAKLGVTEA